MGGESSHFHGWISLEVFENLLGCPRGLFAKSPHLSSLPFFWPMQNVFMTKRMKEGVFSYPHPPPFLHSFRAALNPHFFSGEEEDVSIVHIFFFIIIIMLACCSCSFSKGNKGRKKIREMGTHTNFYAKPQKPWEISPMAGKQRGLPTENTRRRCMRSQFSEIYLLYFPSLPQPKNNSWKLAPGWFLFFSNADFFFFFFLTYWSWALSC